MSYELLKLNIDNFVATVTLNRPEIHNAFNDKLITELITVFNDLDSNDDVRLVVLTGAGRSFCAGADLNWMKKMKDYSLEDNVKDSLELEKLFFTIDNFSKPVIGRINGHALGGGVGLVAVCDYAVTLDNAKFGFTEVRLGLIPAVISPYVMRKIGLSQSRAFFMSGSKFNGIKAMEIQLVHEIVTDENLLDEAIDRLKESFLQAGPQSARIAKQLIKDVGADLMNRESLKDITAKLIASQRVSDEGQEGMSALLEKRKPSWIN